MNEHFLSYFLYLCSKISWIVLIEMLNFIKISKTNRTKQCVNLSPDSSPRKAFQGAFPLTDEAFRAEQLSQRNEALAMSSCKKVRENPIPLLLSFQNYFPDIFWKPGAKTLKRTIATHRIDAPWNFPTRGLLTMSEIERARLAYCVNRENSGKLFFLQHCTLGWCNYTTAGEKTNIDCHQKLAIYR